jgi:CRP-like cAMP-binding protein
VYFIADGAVKFLTVDDIAISILHTGTYFGEVEILRKTYRDSSGKIVKPSYLITLKKNVLWEDIIPKYNEFFQQLLENMIKRFNYREKIKEIVRNI